MHSLTVYYDLDDSLEFREDEIEEISGGTIAGGGTMLNCMVRDCEIQFDTEAELDAAKVELQQAGFRFVPLYDEYEA